MEHSFKVSGEVKLTFPDLVKAAEIFAEAFASKNKVAVSTESSILSGVETKVDTNEISDSVAVMMEQENEQLVTEHLHYGMSSDGKTFTKWEDMCKSLDRAGSAVALRVLAEFSENGEYGGVAPSNWDKVIKACEKSSENIVNESKQKISFSDCQTACATYINQNGKEALKQIFAEFGITKLPDLPEEKFEELMKRVGD